MLSLLDRVEADPDRPLAGTDWRLNWYSGHGFNGACFTQAEPSLRFAADGTYAVTSACLAVHGKYTKGEHKLSLSAARQKHSRCTDACARTMADYVRHLLTSGSVAYDIEATHLELRRSGYAVTAVVAEE